MEQAFQWFGDPTVMRWTPSGPDKSLVQTEARVESYRGHQARHGFSKWVILESSSSRAIGDAGLLVLDDCGWVDLGFRLAQPYWGKGFATEAAAAWVRAAFGQHHLAELGAFAHPENRASLRVLEKLGFRRIRHGRVLDMEALVYALAAGDLTAGERPGR